MSFIQARMQSVNTKAKEKYGGDGSLLKLHLFANLFPWGINEIIAGHVLSSVHHKASETYKPSPLDYESKEAQVDYICFKQLIIDVKLALLLKNIEGSSKNRLRNRYVVAPLKRNPPPTRFRAKRIDDTHNVTLAQPTQDNSLRVLFWL